MADDAATVIESAPPAPATEVPAAEAPKEAKQEVSLDTAMQVFGDTLTYGLGKKKKESPAEKPADKKPTEPSDKQEDHSNNESDKNIGDDKPKESSQQHKPKPKSKPVQRQELDETKLAEIAAEAGGRAASDAISRIERAKVDKVDKPVVESFRPPKEYADQFETFKVMAKSKPDKYGSLVDDFKTFVKQEDDYIKDWKREHPGEAWDSEAEEHSTFYDRATPQYDDGDFRKAEITAELADARKELRKEVLDEVEPRLKKLDEMERAETLRSLQPVVATAERSAMGAILSAIDPTYEKFTDPAELAKLKDEDPVAFDITLAVASDALPFVTEVTRLWKGKGAVKAQDTPLHNYIFAYGQKMGELIKQLPAEDQMRDGKKFATWQEIDAMTPAQQAKHWTLSEDDLIHRKLLDAQEIAKERVAAETKKLDAWAKRKGIANATAQQLSPKQAASEPAKPAPAKAENGSPSVGTRTQVGPSPTPAPSSEPGHMLDFGKLFNGRSL